MNSRMLLRILRMPAMWLGGSCRSQSLKVGKQYEVAQELRLGKFPGDTKVIVSFRSALMWVDTGGGGELIDPYHDLCKDE